MHVTMVDPSRMTPTYDESLCRALGEAGVDLELFTRAGRPSEPRLAEDGYRQRHHFYRWSELVRSRVHTVLSQVLKIPEHAWDLLRLARELRRHPTDVVHVQWLVVPAADWLFIRWARRRTTVVMTVHDTNPLHGVSSWSPQRLGTERCIRDVDALIVHTNYSRRQLGGRARDGQTIAVCRHGVEPVERRDPADDGLLHILLFGRIRPYKGVDVLLDALAELDDDVRAAVRVRIAGSPLMDTEPLLEQSRRLGVDDVVTWDLRFLDEDEVADAFRDTHVLALPYRDIDASGVLYQAAGYGVGIVASAIGGFTDDLVDEQTALLVAPEDPGALAEAITRLHHDRNLLSTLRAGLAADGDANSWAASAQATIDLYEQVTTERSNA